MNEGKSLPEVPLSEPILIHIVKYVISLRYFTLFPLI